MVSTGAPDERPPEEKPRRVIRIELSARTLILLALIIPGLWVLNRILPVVLVLVSALIIVGSVSPAVRFFEARRISRGLGIAIVFSGLMLASVLFITLTIPALIAQVSSLVDQQAAMRERLAGWLEGFHLTNPLADMLRELRVGDLVTLSVSSVLELSGSVVAIFAYILSAVFLALYIMLDRDRLRGGLFLLLPMSHHVRLSRVMLNLETIVGGYIRGQVITSACMALFVFALLTACGVSNALAIAVFAGAADILPYIGSLLVLVAVVGVTLSKSFTVTSIVLLLMLAYEEVENRLIVPHIYGRALRLPSSVIFFALLAGGVLLGIPGALLSLPVAAALLMLIQELRVELPGQQEQAADVTTRKSDERGEAEYERRSEGMPAEQAAAIAVEIATDRHKEERSSPAKPEPPAGPGVDS
ncbi:Predicted PurR-regulated permease PerM [Pseudomonas panipatensis]|uniref:Predicted PurR-regulated permease PerM n=1 Tax=Pseudomonas panipatensis TaxID=428992 RepID=A0A1G8LAM5_9PSED|nr:Predicted PurR-regulated permease PerM [Pseudomonas panipatensis]SMP75296.1 Predicted PurR-regulated permease PerM [Pseudomonas panipatensis]